MLSRRRLLGLAGGTLAGVAGCLDRSDVNGDGSSALSGTGDGPRTTPGDVPEWAPEWTISFEEWHVLGLDAADGRLFATLSQNDGPSAVAAVDPADRSVLWQTESDGEAVGHSHAGYQGISRGQWGVTLADEAVFTVAGPAEERAWSAVHALDRANGDRHWSLRRDRELAVAGVADDLLVVTGVEFFPPPGETPVTHQTPESPLSTVVYGVDVGDGAVRWRHEFVGVENVAVGPDAVYVARSDRLVGLDRNGEVRFTYDHGSPLRVEATAGRVFYLTGDRSAARIHGVAPNGDADWKHALPVEELLLDGDRCYAAGSAVVAVEADGTVTWRDDSHGQWLLLDPDRDALYTRSGGRADGATAYETTGHERWTFDPPSNNAWPEAATSDALVATAITGDHADEPSRTVYAVNSDGEATAALGRDIVFDALGMDGTAYLADGVSELVALEP